MEALNILWQIVPKSQGIIGILRVTAEGGPRQHRRLEIEVEVEARGDQDTPEVIAGIISVYGIEMHALIDPRSTHSYVCIEHVFDKMTAVEQLSYDMHVTSPVGHSVNVIV